MTRDTHQWVCPNCGATFTHTTNTQHFGTLIAFHAERHEATRRAYKARAGW